MAKYKQAKLGLRRETRRAKARYRNRIEVQFAANSSRDVWQGLQDVTRHKPKAAAQIDARPGLTDELNRFYCRFEDNNPNPCFRPSLPDDPSLVTPTICHPMAGAWGEASVYEEEYEKGVGTRWCFHPRSTVLCCPAGPRIHKYLELFSPSTCCASVLLNPPLLCLSLKRRKPSTWTIIDLVRLLQWWWRFLGV